LNGGITHKDPPLVNKRHWIYKKPIKVMGKCDVELLEIKEQQMPDELNLDDGKNCIWMVYSQDNN